MKHPHALIRLLSACIQWYDDIYIIVKVFTIYYIYILHGQMRISICESQGATLFIYPNNKE